MRRARPTPSDCFFVLPRHWRAGSSHAQDDIVEGIGGERCCFDGGERWGGGGGGKESVVSISKYYFEIKSTLSRIVVRNVGKGGTTDGVHEKGIEWERARQSFGLCFQGVFVGDILLIVVIFRGGYTQTHTHPHAAVTRVPRLSPHHFF